MIQQQLFELGSKFIGLYCVAMSFPNLVSGVLEILVSEGSGEPRVDSYASFTAIIFTFSSFLLSGIGLLLFRRTDLVQRIAFSEQDQDYDSNLEEPFAIGVKLFGAFLFLRTLPSFLRLLSNYIFIANSPADSPPMIGQFFERMGNFLPPLVTLLFGLLLFFRGELLSRWAFAKRQDLEISD